jgi:hypothetical protein
MGADESRCASDQDVSATVSLSLLDCESCTYEGFSVDIFFIDVCEMISWKLSMEGGLGQPRVGELGVDASGTLGGPHAGA